MVYVDLEAGSSEIVLMEEASMQRNCCHSVAAETRTSAVTDDSVEKLVAVRVTEDLDVGLLESQVVAAAAAAAISATTVAAALKGSAAVNAAFVVSVTNFAAVAAFEPVVVVDAAAAAEVYSFVPWIDETASLAVRMSAVPNFC